MDSTINDNGSTQRDSVTLVKGSHRWTFRCDADQEPLLLARLGDLARDPGASFDWFDAALVTHQLRSRLRPALERRGTQPDATATVTNPSGNDCAPTTGGHPARPA